MARVTKNYEIASNWSYTGNSNQGAGYSVSAIQTWLQNNIPSTATITSAELWLTGYWTPNSEVFGGSMRFGVRCWFSDSAGANSGTQLLAATFDKNNSNGYYSSLTIKNYIQSTYPFTINTSYPYIGFYIVGDSTYTQKRTFNVPNFVLTIEYEEHEHSYTSTVTTAATCMSEGVRTYTCSCGQGSYTESIAKDPNNHVGGTEIRNAVAATCASTGYTGDTYCKGCGAKLSGGSTIAKLAHTEVTIPAVAPTCTVAGSTEGKKCSVCGEILVAPTVVPATGHSYTTQTVDPTDKSKGYTRHICSCGDYYDTDPTCLATFLDGDGSVLETVIVPEGGTPTPTKTPTKDYTDDYTYIWVTHMPWQPKIGPISESQTYEPVFGSIQYYTVDTSLLDGVPGCKSIEVAALAGERHPSGSDKFTYNSLVKVTIEVAEGYMFNGWEDGSTELSRQIIVTDSISISATFEKIFYKVEYKEMMSEGCAGFGFSLIEGERQTDEKYEYFSHGSIIEVFTEVKEGYKFLHWEDGSTDNPRYVTITGDFTPSAVYEKLASTIPIYVNEVQAKSVYINPTTKTIIIVIDGEVPEVTKDNDTLDDWHVEVANTVPNNSFLVEKIYKDEVQIM